MIIGIGTDICAIKRIQETQQHHRGRFEERLCTPEELKNRPNPTPARLAKIWAAKEATSKALGVGIGAHLSFQDIQITRNDLGKPLLTVTKPAYADYTYHLSLADEADYAIAFVTVENRAL